MSDTAVQKPIDWLSRSAVPDHVQIDTVHKLSTNENPLGPSPAVIGAIHSLASQVHEYPQTNDKKLRQALAETYGRGLTPEHFFAANSGCEGLEFIGKAFLGQDEECIICSPAFSVYHWVAGLQKAKIVDVPLDPETLTHRIDAILEAVTDHTRVIFMCNPHNPAGTIVTAPEMERLYDNLPDHVIVVSDEVYIHYVDHPEFPDSIADMNAGRNVIMLYSFSKAYALAGMRLGFGIARPDLAARVAAYCRTFHLGTLTLEAGIAALRDDVHLKKSVDAARSGKTWLYEQFDRLGLKTWPSETNFILVQPPVPANEVAVRLLDYGVIVMPMEKYGLPKCIRITVGLPEANEACVRALEETIGGIDGLTIDD